MNFTPYQDFMTLLEGIFESDIDLIEFLSASLFRAEDLDSLIRKI